LIFGENCCIKRLSQDGSFLSNISQWSIPYAVSGIGGLFEAAEGDVIFSIFSYLGGFKKLLDTKADEGESPEPAGIYEEAAEIFHLSTKRQFVKDLQALHDHLQEQRRLQLQGL